MTEYYRGERISDLLQRIEELKVILDENQMSATADEALRVIQAYAELAIAKAKLTALKGE
jgi:hypothetical protein